MSLGKNLVINFYSYLFFIITLAILIYFENYFKLFSLLTLMISLLILKNYKQKLKLYEHTLFLIKNKKIYKSKDKHFNDLCSLTILILILSQKFKFKRALKLFLVLKRKSVDQFHINFV